MSDPKEPPPPPQYPEPDADSLVFRAALDKAGSILASLGHPPVGVYSRHRHHFDMSGDKVMFEHQLAPGLLALSPMPRETAARRGLPSCWGITSAGKIVVLRYADVHLHEQSAVDVTSRQFLETLDTIGAAFARADLHYLLEVNIANKLFPTADGYVTFESTDRELPYQVVTIVPTPQRILSGEWTNVSCLGFDNSGKPVVTGFCGEYTSS